jgi:hypothetical protein
VEFRSERFDDASLPNPDGTYDYRYTGVTYFATMPEGREIVFRVYDDEPTVAGLVAPTSWTPEWLQSPSVREALRLLQQLTGVQALRLYNKMSGTFSDVVPMPAVDATSLDTDQ